MNISILKDKYDNYIRHIMELEEEDYENEEVQKEIDATRDAFWNRAKSLGVFRCGYSWDHSTFMVYYRDGIVETTPVIK